MIKWLEKNHLNHAAITLVGFWPLLQINLLIDGSAWTTALMWYLIYYSREVAQNYNKGLFKSLNPWAWSYHDRIQTLYVAIVAGVLGYAFI